MMQLIKDSPKAWQGKVWKQWLALLFVLPIYIFPVARYLSKEGSFSLRDMFIYSGVICAIEIAAILFLQRILIGEKISALNLKSARLRQDFLAGILLGIVTLVFSFVVRAILSRWLENETVSSMGGLFDGLLTNPKLTILWLGPLILIGVSQEELTRAFTLNRLWRIWPKPAGVWFATIISALIFALAHIFEGLTGVIWAALYGLIMAIYYIYYGRLTPMIISHYFNNAFNFIAILILIQQGSIQL
ncbi:MAG: CPBP family intramembrane metalloprotease [Anaerolineales bacterium]|nr:CPBP family intramembrane metalloprotease [Anaerolineales bacterium]